MMTILSFRRKMRSFSVHLLFTSLQGEPDKPTNAPVLVYNLNGTVIMLQIVMVSPGTHLVKNHISPTPEPMRPSSTRNNEALGLWKQTVNLKTDCKLYITVY